MTLPRTFQTVNIGPVAPNTTVSDNRKTVATAGTREQLGSGAAGTVIICAETDNTGMVVVGGSTVVATLATRRGIPLGPGDCVIVSVQTLDVIWLDVEVNGDGVTYVVLA